MTKKRVSKKFTITVDDCKRKSLFMSKYPQLEEGLCVLFKQQEVDMPLFQ